MNRALARRVGALAILLIATLVAQTAVSTAQPYGTELAEDVSADVSGPEASIALVDVSAFPSSGEARFEPGTTNEEAFSYSSVDRETNRLIGLTRPAPTDHSAGSFVEAGSEQSPSPTSSPAEQSPEGATTQDDPSASEPSAESSESCGTDSDPPTCYVPEIPECHSDDCTPVLSGECQPGGTDSEPLTCEVERAAAGITAATATAIGCAADLVSCGPTAPLFMYSQPVETVIPVPDLGGGADDLHTPCYLFTRITRLGVAKPSGSVDAKEYAEGYVRTNCESPRIRSLKTQAAIYHHSFIPLIGSTISTQDSDEGGPPGPVYAHAFQEVRIFPDHGHGSKINFYVIFRAVLRGGQEARAMECYSMMYGFTPPTLVSCGEELPILLIS